MAFQMPLRMQWGEETVQDFAQLGIQVSAAPSPPLNFGTSAKGDKGEGKGYGKGGKGHALTIDDIAAQIEMITAGLHFKSTGQQIQVQISSIRPAQRLGSEDLDFDALASDCLEPGECIEIEAQAVTEDMFRSMQKRNPTEQEIEEFRKTLRFGLNDRVLCNCGERWFAGLVVGTAVPDDELLPYLVKTDPVPNAPTRTISVPCDIDDVCVQEVCFDPDSQLEFVKYAAPPVVNQSKRLRFAVGDKVVCRVRNSKEDDLECWVPGTVSSLWPQLPGERAWDMGGGISGLYADVVPYKVDLHTKTGIYCHKDHHTLIRRQGMEPQTRVRGISKRMEDRKSEDGKKILIDHETERRKVIAEESDDSDD